MTTPFLDNLVLLLLALAALCLIGAVGAFVCDFLDNHWPL